MNSLIKVIDVSKKYDNQRIFSNLNLDIKESEILVILGSSGVGKSTLINILSKVDKDFDGKIIYSDKISKDINIPLPVVFQEFDQLLPWFTVKKNILLPLKITKENKKDIEKELDEILNLTGLSDSVNKYPVQLSGGMKQRTAIARALMCDSKILFMDEPFGSLDFKMRENLQNLIKQINRKYNKTIVFITHDIEEAILIGDRIVVLNDDNFELNVSEIDNCKSDEFIETIRKIKIV